MKRGTPESPAPSAPVSDPVSAPLPRGLIVAVCVALAVATALPYIDVGSFGFVSFDDPGYVRDNPLVNGGLRLEAVGDAFSKTTMANWHPLTWISHMLDCELFGLEPGGHHAMNVGLHVLNAVLLLLALRALTGSLWRSALVAALFALHPLRVESVAWISERKDVLSGTFWMLTLLTYARHVRRPTQNSFSLLLIMFGLGLLAKPMLVTLPFVLLLLDAWPLRRAGSGTERSRFPRVSLRELLREKAWMLGIAGLVALATLYAQRAGEALKSTQLIALDARLLNAFSATTRYISKSLWPSDLAFFYPHPAHLGQPYANAGLLSLGVLVAITALATRLRTSRPWLLVGWLWFLGTLVPVIGLVQVGEQSMADRYTYLPAIGLGIMLAWELGHLVRERAIFVRLVSGACVLVLFGLGLRTHQQAATWADSETLYQHALAVTDDNYTAHTLLGALYLDADELTRAQVHLDSALAIDARDPRALYNLGSVYMKRGENTEAKAHFREALRMRPQGSEAHNNLGILLANEGRYREALEHLRLAVEYGPDNASAAHNLRSVQQMSRHKQREAADVARDPPPGR